MEQETETRRTKNASTTFNILIVMIITMSNYKSFLPKKLWDKFIFMAGLERPGYIVFVDGVLKRKI